MKKLNTVQEIAKEVNINLLPTVKIDVSKRDEYGIKGVNVRVFEGYHNGCPMMTDAEVRVYSDEKILKFSSGGFGIKASYGYYDVIEMYEQSNLPVIKENSQFVLIIENSDKKVIHEAMVVDTYKINKFCMTPINIEKVSFDKYF